METTQLNLTQQAKDYLLNDRNPYHLYVKYEGKKRQIFVNGRETNYPIFCMVAKGHRRKGYRFNDWGNIEQVYFPPQGAERENALHQQQMRITQKCKKLASKASSFTNKFIREYANADPNKTLWENGIGIGGAFEGTVLNYSTIEKKQPIYMKEFCDALKEKKEYRAAFEFNGYIGHLIVSMYEGEPVGYFNKELRLYGIAYRYMAINDECFIGLAKS